MVCLYIAISFLTGRLTEPVKTKDVGLCPQALRCLTGSKFAPNLRVTSIIIYKYTILSILNINKETRNEN